MDKKRIGILLALVGFLLVVWVAGKIWIQRINAPEEEVIKTVKPAENTQAVGNIRAAGGTNIIICVLDAARFDHMGCYGYPRPTTPNIDRLAKDSLVFEQHYCQYPMTELSTRALFESKYIVPRITQSASLVESLQRLGFSTLLFTANPRIIGTGTAGRGFDNIGKDAEVAAGSRMKRVGQISRPKFEKKLEEDFFYKPEYVLTEVNHWLAKKPKSPFFTYLHFVPPHIPYEAPKNIKAIFKGKQPPLYWKAPSAMPKKKKPSYPSMPWETPPDKSKDAAPASALAGTVEESINLYDANMRWADEAVGKLEQALRKAGLFDNTLLIIMADHGEALGEHGYNWHPFCPYDEVLHIPLIIHFPGKDAPRGRIKTLTQTIDLLPTLFDLHNKPWPATAQGRSLLPMLAGETARTNEYSFSAAGNSWLCENFVVRDLQSSLLLSDDGKTRALYDSATDSHQTKNIIKSEPARAAKLVEAFRQFALAQADPPLYFLDPTVKRKLGKIAVQPQTKDMPEKLKKQLKTLGYLK